MGASYSTYIVVGFDANDVIEVKRETVVQVKYNEDTGIPYTMETKKENKYFGNIDITKSDLEDCVPKLMPGMDVYQADHEDEEGKVIIGIAVKSLKKPCVSELKTTEIELIRQQIKAQAMSNLELDIEPSVFVVFYCSY